jgi:hypothetical protein
MPRPRRVAAVTAVAALAAGGVGGCSSGTVLELEVGDCLHSSDLRAEAVVDVAVDCSEPHDAEIFAATELPDGDYPGVEAVRTAAYDYCLPLFDGFVGVPYLSSDLDVYPLLPSEDSWTSAGDREILCVIVAPEDVTQTLANSQR